MKIAAASVIRSLAEPGISARRNICPNSAATGSLFVDNPNHHYAIPGPEEGIVVDGFDGCWDRASIRVHEITA